MISVCMAALNGEKYIKAQIDSIISQLTAEDEIIVVDSNSMDNTVQILESYNDNRIKILHFDNSNIGGGEFKTVNRIRAAFLLAISNAKGDTLYLSDQDDIWLPQKVKVCEEHLKRFEVICHDCEIIDNDLVRHGIFKREKVGYLQNFINPPFHGCCVAFTRKVADELLFSLHRLNNIEIAHDHLVGFTSMIFNGKKSIGIIHESLLLYRRHGANASPTMGKSPNSLRFKFTYRLNDLKCYYLLCKAKKAIIKLKNKV